MNQFNYNVHVVLHVYIVYEYYITQYMMYPHGHCMTMIVSPFSSSIPFEFENYSKVYRYYNYISKKMREEYRRKQILGDMAILLFKVSKRKLPYTVISNC